MWIKGESKTNAETYSDFFFLHNHSEDLLHKRRFPCIYAYTRKQIKVIFYLNRSQRDMIFPFNDRSELTVSTLVVHANLHFQVSS